MQFLTRYGIYACQKSFREQFTLSSILEFQETKKGRPIVRFAYSKVHLLQGASCIFFSIGRGVALSWLHGRLLILRVRFLRDRAPA